MNTIKKLMPVLLLIATGLANAAHAALIHSYDYVGNANDGTGSANGTVVNALLTNDRFGKSNSAYLFNGQSYINSYFTNPLTTSIAIWAKLGTQSDTGDMLFSLDSSNANGINLWLYDYPSADALWNTWDSASNAFIGTNGLISSIRDNLFHHFVVVNDQSTNTASLFVDGALAGSATYRLPSGTLFKVGAGKKDLGYGWDGVIDDVEVYDNALTSEQVSTLYRTGSIDVPAPASLSIMVLGFAGLLVRRLKK